MAEPRTAIALVLPFPPAALNPNRARTKHRMEVAGIAAAYRQECKIDSLNARRYWEADGVVFPLKTPVLARLKFVLSSRRRHDIDNLLSAFKPGLDGIVDAGLLADDDCWSLRLAIDIEKGGAQYLRVELEAAS